MSHFVVGNEQRFPLLLETNNRGDYHFSDKKLSFLLPIYKVWNSDIFNICFFGQLDFFFLGNITWISGNMTQFSADMTTGKITLGQLDCKPGQDMLPLSTHKYKMTVPSKL